MRGGVQYCIYGDPEYVLRPDMVFGFEGANLSAPQRMFNKYMSRVRTSVEWAFKDVKKYFTHVDFPRKMKLGMVTVEMVYIVSAILWNFRTCLYGSQTRKFFDCPPSDFSTYIELA